MMQMQESSKAGTVLIHNVDAYLTDTCVLLEIAISEVEMLRQHFTLSRRLVHTSDNVTF